MDHTDINSTKTDEARQRGKLNNTDVYFTGTERDDFMKIMEEHKIKQEQKKYLTKPPLKRESGGGAAASAANTMENPIIIDDDDDDDELNELMKKVPSHW